MINLIKIATKQYYVWGCLLIIFFFLRGGEFLFNNFSPNWAYVFDQLGLAVVGGSLGLVWLRKKEHFRLGWVIGLLIIFIVLMSHYHSFYRTFFFAELRNIISPLSMLNGYHGDPSAIVPGFAGPSGIRERYGWSFSTLIYELVGVGHSYSIPVWASSSIFLLVIASLSTAWLTGVLSKSKTAALIAGLLIGTPVNSFMSNLWITNIQTDGLGVILVTFTVGIWFIARHTKDKKGIFIALILLAATLKGGSISRTAMTGFLLILTDLIFFSSGILKKRAWIDWLKILAITSVYYLANPAAHWHPASTPSSATMSFPTRLAFLADGTTRSFFSPELLIKLVNHLSGLSSEITWTVVVGTIIVIAGTILAVLSLFSSRYKYFAWGWGWFFICFWYIPWLAELHAKPDSIVTNLDFAGYEFAYLSLVGLYIAVGILLSNQIKKIYSLTEGKQKILGLFFILFTAGILSYRTYEFVKLDYNWRVDYSARVRAWYNLVFGMFPPTAGLREQSKNPSALVELDKDHIGMEADLFIPTLYYDGSLLFYYDMTLFRNEIILEKKIPIDRIYAIAWDSDKLKMINLTPIFRRFLAGSPNINQQIPNFKKWYK